MQNFLDIFFPLSLPLTGQSLSPDEPQVLMLWGTGDQVVTEAGHELLMASTRPHAVGAFAVRGRARSSGGRQSWAQSWAMERKVTSLVIFGILGSFRSFFT